MKKIVLLLSLIQLIISLKAENIPWESGQELNVFAPSGLKLRAAPGTDAEILDIVHYGDVVTVINSFEFSDDKKDRIDWIDGHWILVDFQGIAGYLFDGFLSNLNFPGSEAELKNDGYSFAYALGEYFDRNFTFHRMLDSTANHQIYLLDQGIKVKRVHADTSWNIWIELPEHKISDVLNVMRGMIEYRQERTQFEKSLIYIEGMDGQVKKVKANLDNPVIIEKKQNGNILVKASGLSSC